VHNFVNLSSGNYRCLLIKYNINATITAVAFCELFLIEQRGGATDHADSQIDVFAKMAFEKMLQFKTRAC
jgi:hypothetical protein